MDFGLLAKNVVGNRKVVSFLTYSISRKIRLREPEINSK